MLDHTMQEISRLIGHQVAVWKNARNQTFQGLEGNEALAGKWSWLDLAFNPNIRSALHLSISPVP